MQSHEYLNKSWQHGTLSRIGCVSTLPPAQLPSYERGHSRLMAAASISWVFLCQKEKTTAQSMTATACIWPLSHCQRKNCVGVWQVSSAAKVIAVQVWSLKVNPLNSREGERREQTSQSYPLIFTPVPWNMLLPPRVSYIHADAHTIS